MQSLFKKWSDHMKSVFNRVCVCLLLSLVPGISAGASAEIDRALDILLKDYDLGKKYFNLGILKIAF